MTPAIMEVVILKLGGALQQVHNQASLLLHFRQDLLWMREKLTLAYEARNEAVQQWLADVQNIALDTEDIVEECAVQPLNKDSLIFLRYKMKRRFRKLKDRLNSILRDANEYNLLQYDIGQPQPFRSEERKRPRLIERDARRVGIHAKVEQILNLLEDNEVQVIGIVGMGGAGKTFLLQNVYNHPVVRQRFKKAIWLSISRTYSVANFQSDIASHLGFRVGRDLSEQGAAELIYQRLRHMSSLIVLDDIWMREGLDSLIGKLGIPTGTSNPCKVVVTTRDMRVCTSIRASSIYQMDRLSEKDSWKLFCLHAFGDDEQNTPPPELELVAREVERECRGLPLAIKTVASSMAGEKLFRSWELKLRQLKEVSDHQNHVMSILRWSYDALHPVVKFCFLYFSFFGEAMEIDPEYLIYLWMGGGLIPEGKEQWDIGLSYLNELHNESLVEVIEDREFKKTCKINGLLIDLAISIFKENNCAFIVEEASARGCRHILLAKKGLDNYDIRNIQLYPPSLRTLSLSQNTISKLPGRPFKGVRSLRVIDVSHTHILKLPRFIGNMKLLRVLNLSDTKFAEVPDCVRNLKSLYFLNVGSCPLPEWIGELKCLQHLHGEVISYSRKLSKGLSKLDSLRTLRSNNPSPLVLKDVAKLIHLQELHIEIANEEERRSLEGGVLQPLVNMRHLKMVDESLSGPFPEVMKAMEALERLVLYGFTVPERIWDYVNIRVLELESCDLSQFPALHTMPSLMHLRLIRGRHCKELPEWFGRRGAFPELRYLEVSDCPKLQKLPDLQPGAMPLVEVFIVYACESVENIPQGFEHRRSLKFIYLTGMAVPDEEKEKLRKDGEYWERIRASNPYVTTIIS